MMNIRIGVELDRDDLYQFFLYISPLHSKDKDKETCVLVTKSRKKLINAISKLIDL